MTFQIDGVDKKTNEKRSVSIEARDQATAAYMALQVGIMVSSIRPLASSTSVVDYRTETEVEEDEEEEEDDDESTVLPSRVRRSVPASTVTSPATMFLYAVLGLVAAFLIVWGLRDLVWEATTAYTYSPDVTAVDDHRQVDADGNPVAAPEAAPPTSESSAVAAAAQPPVWLNSVTSSFVQEETARHVLGMTKWVAAALLGVLMELIHLRDQSVRRRL